MRAARAGPVLNSQGPCAGSPKWARKGPVQACLQGVLPKIIIFIFTRCLLLKIIIYFMLFIKTTLY